MHAMEPLQLILIIGFIVAGAAAAYYIPRQSSSNITKEGIKKEATKILHDSRSQASSLRNKTKSELKEIKRMAQEENQRLEKHLERLKESAKLKEKHVNEKKQKNKEILGWLKTETELITQMKSEIENSTENIIKTLLKDLGFSKKDAVEEIKNRLTSQILKSKDTYLRNREEEAEEDSLRNAKNILINTIQRYSDKSSVDHNQTFVEVKREQFKAELVGLNCENVDYLEKRSEVEIIFNDYPKTITVGGFHLVRRHIVKNAIQILQRKKGRINKEKIEASLKEAQKAVGTTMVQKAREAVKIVGLKNVPNKVLKHIGRLHFRTSYGQNVLRHSLEVGMFAGLLAAEVGADVQKAREAGFLHDIGKALSEESDKGHDELTKDILEECGYPEDIVHAAWAHHEGEPAQSLEAKIIMAADALSASRPGARLESLERYLQRIKELEQTAASFPGIKKTFALSAGREVRVLVNPDQVNDETMSGLAHDIADKIETNLSYPGNVKVNVIRRMLFKSKATGPEKESKNN
jgi:ribonucrease Y